MLFRSTRTAALKPAPRQAVPAKPATPKAAAASVRDLATPSNYPTARTTPATTQQLSAPPAPKQGQGKRWRRGDKAAKEAGQPATAAKEPHFIPAPAPPPLTEQWTQVVKRGSKKTRSAGQVSSQQKASTAPKPTMIRPPRSSAVVLTLQPEAAKKGVTYARVLAEAKKKVDFGALELPGLRFRVAATGARMLILPGAKSEDKADALAEKLRAAVGEDIHVSRPTKCAEMRISGLDDSVTPAEVASAVARAGECSVDAVKTGEIRQNAFGLGTIWVRLPIAAANKAANKGRILVGFVSAQVRLLEPRPRQCFRCLELGHVKTQCTCEHDRSGQCYRCGQLGHKAAGCSEKPHCSVCALKNKPADHTVGSKACAARQVKRGRPRRGGNTARPPAARVEEVEMAD